jgi:predicted transcriptional regulator
MIRAKDSGNNIVLGLTRPEIEGLLAGKTCCFQANVPYEGAQHVCIYFGETNRDVLERMRAAYHPDPATQDALDNPRDLRTRPERGDN